MIVVISPPEAASLSSLSCVAQPVRLGHCDHSSHPPPFVVISVLPSVSLTKTDLSFSSLSWIAEPVIPMGRWPMGFPFTCTARQAISRKRKGRTERKGNETRQQERERDRETGKRSVKRSVPEISSYCLPLCHARSEVTSPSPSCRLLFSCLPRISPFSAVNSRPTMSSLA